MNDRTNLAHEQDYHANRFGKQTWRDAGIASKHGANTCSYCGSISPMDLAHSIAKHGAKLDPADRKYGWPHKFYIAAGSDATIDYAKFYTVHLTDATERERTIIERAMGMNIRFNDDGSVQWKAFAEPEPAHPFLDPINHG